MVRVAALAARYWRRSVPLVGEEGAMVQQEQQAERSGTVERVEDIQWQALRAALIGEGPLRFDETHPVVRYSSRRSSQPA